MVLYPQTKERAKMSEFNGAGYVTIRVEDYDRLLAYSEQLEQLENDYSEHFSYRVMSEDEKGNVYIDVKADIDLFSSGIAQMKMKAMNEVIPFPSLGRRIFVNKLIIERTETRKDFIFSEDIGEGPGHE